MKDQAEADTDLSWQQRVALGAGKSIFLKNYYALLPNIKLLLKSVLLYYRVQIPK